MRRIIASCLAASQLLAFNNSLVESDNRLSSELFYLTGQTGFNTLISPYAIAANLQLLLMAANGPTANDIRSTLNIQIPQGNVPSSFESLHKRLKSTIHLANGMWVNTGSELSARFQSRLENYFGVKVMGAPYKQASATTTLMNQWISKETNKQLLSVVPAGNLIDQNTIVLTSGLSAKGSWEHPFETKYSRNAVFYPTLNDDAEETTRFMQLEHIFPYDETPDYQVVALPLDKRFRENHLAFVVFMLKDNLKSEDPFNFLFSKNPSYYSVIKNLKNKLVRVTLPLFSYHINTELTSTLLSMGMELPFSSKANFSNLSQRTKLHLGHVYHGAEMSINENGINVSSPSESRGHHRERSPDKNALSFNANRPFFYMLADLDSGLIISMGTFASTKLTQAQMPKYTPQKLPKVPKGGTSPEGAQGQPRGKEMQPTAPSQPPVDDTYDAIPDPNSENAPIYNPPTDN